jgi:RNA polymerase sigma-70 factor, ECF subfamily
MNFGRADRLTGCEVMRAMPTTDQRVLRAEAQAGDERAFRELVDPYRRTLEVHCYRMLGSIHDAEDIVQETLLRAWRGLDRFEGRSSTETWLYRIATNACLDEIERRPRRPIPVEPYPDDRLEEAAGPVADPAARYAAREGVELAFLTAIQKLPGRQRAILVLRDVLGWTSPEVAELLDSTGAAVNSALQRARETIDRELPATSPAAAAPSQRRLLDDFVEAWTDQDIDRLVALLRDDAVLRMPPQPSVTGAREVVRFFAERGCGRGFERIRLVPTAANGRPAVAMTVTEDDGSRTPHGILTFEMEDDRIAAVDAFIDESIVGYFATA